jgi:hypothetical protein
MVLLVLACVLNVLLDTASSVICGASFYVRLQQQKLLVLFLLHDVMLRVNSVWGTRVFEGLDLCFSNPFFHGWTPELIFEIPWYSSLPVKTYTGLSTILARTRSYCHLINPLTPELNLSAQRCLTRFLVGILRLEPCISLIYAWKSNKFNNYSFSLLITYGSPYMFRHYMAIRRERSSCRGTLPEDGNVMPKHVGATIHN